MSQRHSENAQSAQEGKELGSEESTRRILYSLRPGAKMQQCKHNIFNAQGSLLETQHLGSFLGVACIDVSMQQLQHSRLPKKKKHMFIINHTAHTAQAQRIYLIS